MQRGSRDVGSERVSDADRQGTHQLTLYNGARRPGYSWPIDGIEIRPDRNSKWTSRRSGNSYYLRQRLRLESADRSADLTINMAMKDQEFQEQPGGLWDYEGIGEVRGKLNGRSVKGQAFLEMVPSTVAPPALSR